MSVNSDVNEQVAQFCAWYGDGSDGSVPTAAQWERVLARPADRPLSLVNFFKLNDRAHYDSADARDTESISGLEAFGRYAEVSRPALDRAGGRFLHVGPFAGALWGAEEDWDIVVVASYPNLKAFVDLYGDEDYRRAFAHRAAACARQKVCISDEAPAA